MTTPSSSTGPRHVAPRQTVKVLLNPVVSDKENYDPAHLLGIFALRGLSPHPLSVAELTKELKASPSSPPNVSGETYAVVGGDGTLHQVLNTLGRQRMEKSRFMVIPAGTANDLARSLEIPLEPAAACEALCASGRELAVDVGLLTLPDDREILFSCALSLGFGPEVTKLATRQVRNWIGKAALVWGTLRYFAQAEKPVHKLKLHYHGRNKSISIQQLVIGNCKYHGGGFPITPTAGVRTGRLDIYRVKPLGFWDYVMIFGRVLIGVDHTTYRKKIKHLRLKELVLELPKPLDADIDGEIYRLPAGKLRLRVLPSAMRVVVPDEEAHAPPSSQGEGVHEAAGSGRQIVGGPSLAE